MTIQTCPDHQTLQQFLLGKMPAPNTKVIAEHIATCSICAATAETLNDGDDLTEAIARSAEAQATPPEAETAALQAAMEESKSISGRLNSQTGGPSPPHPTTTARPNTGVTPSGGQSENKKYDLSFLAPARQPDELGRLGNYRVLELLGAGGMGMVFKAEDIQLGRLVALKVMLPHIAANPESKARFLREARATAALSHDHIVQIHQVGEDGGVPFIAMQYLEGRSLQAAFKRLKKVRGVDVARIGKQVSLGLAAAHEKGLIHRDIKPDNLWIEAKTGRVKILDFGLARNQNTDADLTQSGTILGTPRYMAPEQITGEKVDHRADLYSLGCMLYHLAAGQPAFTDSSIAALLFSITNAAPRPIQELAPKLDPQLAKLIMGLLSKNPQDRPASAGATASEFARIEARIVSATKGTASSIPPVTNPLLAVRPPRKPPKRRWPLIAAGAAGFALLLGIIVITIRSPDGTETTVRVAEGTITNVHAEQGSQVEIEQQPGGLGATQPQPDAARQRITEPERESGTSTTVAADAVRPEFPNAMFTWAGVLPEHAPPPAIAPMTPSEAQQCQRAWAEFMGLPVEFTLKLPGDIPLALMVIPPGEFTMGSGQSEQERFIELAKPFGDRYSEFRIRSEGPAKRVQITKPFLLGKLEVTQDQWLALMPMNPSRFKDSGDLPVERVNWAQAQEYVEKLQATVGDGWQFALPTEAQWEYACRAGSTTVWHFGDSIEELPRYAWVEQGSRGRTRPSGTLLPNSWGLYDMHGNVQQWCTDFYDHKYYSKTDPIDPTGPESGDARVFRGGEWYRDATISRSASRFNHEPDLEWHALGLRVVAIPPVTPQIP